ncbi:MAG: peroxiredoxin family protein [Nitrospinales bacterium]
MRKFFLSWAIILVSVSVVSAKAPVAGDIAPDFSLTCLNNKKISLSQFRGKVVLMGMFHICVPCMRQAMEFEKAFKALSSDKLAVIGVNTFGDSKKAVADYLNGFPAPISFTYCLDPEVTVHKAYIQREMPTVLIIGPDGVILARTPFVDADQLIPYLKNLL